MIRLFDLGSNPAWILPDQSRGEFFCHSALINTWQVAQEHSPPQSASMPGTKLPVAATMIDLTVCRVDSVLGAVEFNEFNLWHGYVSSVVSH